MKKEKAKVRVEVAVHSLTRMSKNMSIEFQSEMKEVSDIPEKTEK